MFRVFLLLIARIFFLQNLLGGVMKSQIVHSIEESDPDVCMDCGMHIEHEDFTWHHPEALSDDQMHQELV